MTDIRMLEFFSGIGGMRCAVQAALKDTDQSLASCTAYDISLTANAVYRANFDDKVCTKLVEQLHSVPAADLWTMSPPCQPFTTTRLAKQLDTKDKRTAGFLALLQLLERLSEHDRPRWIFIENVVGFSQSQARQRLLSALQSSGYSWKEYLLSPRQLGIPNHRRRYYLLAERSNRFIHELSTVRETLPATVHATGMYPRPLSDFLLDITPSHPDWSTYAIPDDVLQQPWAKDLGMVGVADTHSHCFTAGYARQLHRATGSLLTMDRPSVAHQPMDRDNMMGLSNKVRRLTPEELLRLFGFGHDYQFPMAISREQRYRLIGNSVSVFVITELVRELLLGS